MKQTNTHPLIADYLDQVCRHVRATEMHRRIRDELESHLLDLMDEQMDEPYGKHLIFSIVPLFSLFFNWPLLMSTGMLPIVRLEIPFLSYGNIGTSLAHFAVLGLVLSVHRHKNSIGKPHTFVAK